ncbi:MAG: addiction module protein [Calditrichaeota bacterium]|nr:MAG: addiction module protein [Calditrichota bacterium]MBL1204504.1 addiction module protein [Calditrichota bacterium]NOG44333.1 addiction module protein [Calditrichota bacterium]
MDLLKKIEKEIEGLTNQERAFLADRLLGSLSENKQSEVDEAWVEEAERRYEDYKKGNRPGVEAKSVFHKANLLHK